MSITRSLRILLSNVGMKRFEPSRNGLGLNNILYVSILMELREGIEEIPVFKPIVVEAPPTPKPALFDNLRKFELMAFGVPEEWVDEVCTHVPSLGPNRRGAAALTHPLSG